jgi:F420-dependent oxidoreductase-like protein
MIEGQEDVTWEDWLELARTCERLGFEALFRSDHYLSVMGGGERGSLDAWATIAGLAAVTDRLRLGTLVSPATFRHPSVLAKLVVTADHISGGRIELGLGTGWLEAEHVAYGFPFPPMPERMDRMAEQLAIIHGSWAAGPFDHDGEHWQLRGLDAQPKPLQRPHPPLLLGGRAARRGAALAARWASEYNLVGASPDAVRAARSRLDAACAEAGRDPSTLPLSLMQQCVLGADEAELRERAAVFGRSPDELRSAVLAGTPDELVARLQEYADAGVQRVMLQHLAHRDSAALELLADAVVPALA